MSKYDAFPHPKHSPVIPQTINRGLYVPSQALEALLTPFSLPVKVFQGYDDYDAQSSTTSLCSAMARVWLFWSIMT